MKYVKRTKELEKIRKWVCEDKIVSETICPKKDTEYNYRIDRAIALTYNKTRRNLIKELRLAFRDWKCSNDSSNIGLDDKEKTDIMITIDEVFEEEEK
jgi:hypothetical protein